MAKVSIIIPSRQEPFLIPTIMDMLAHATGEIEIIAVLDGGAWPTQPLPDDPRVRILRRNVSMGMREAINAATRIATGDYFLKCDAHTSWEPGFDEVLKADYQEHNWILVPRRDRLDAERWCLQETGKAPIDAHYLSYPFERLNDPTCGLHGTVWNARAKARRDVLLDEEMSSQGSAWFMSRQHWEQRIGPMDAQSYGNFIQEFQEIGLKTWLGGGKVMVTKRTTYLHLHKGKQYGRFYFLDAREQRRGSDFAIRYWMLDQWPKRVRNLRWLIERFAPVPTWPADLDLAFARAREALAHAA